MSAVDSQCDAILRGLDLCQATAQVQMKAVTVVIETASRKIRLAVTEGRMDKVRLSQFRDGTYPAPVALERAARELHDEGVAYQQQRGAR